MSTAASLLDGYVKSNTNKFFKHGNEWCGRFDDGFFKFGQHSANFSEAIAKYTDNTEAQEKARYAASGFDAGRATISAVRFVFPLHKLFTGQMFWQTGENGWRMALGQNGVPVKIPKEDIESGEWVHVVDAESGKKIWINNTDGLKSLDGKYIEVEEGDPNGVYLARDWMDIVMDICILAARLISPFRWLHNLKALDLGKHAKWMGSIVMAAWGIVLSIGLVQAIRDLNDERDAGVIRQRIWEAFQAFIDLISLPFDFGVASAHPVGAIIGAVLNMIAAASLIVKDIVYYDP